MSTIRKIELMHRLYGANHRHFCADCCNFSENRRGRKYFKCAVYGESSSEATDWRKHYVACGRFGQPVSENARPVVAYVRPERVPQKALPGQTKLEF